MFSCYCISQPFFITVLAALSCSCYSFQVDKLPWHKSRQRCLDNGGDLVSMETEEEWSFVNNKIQQRSDMEEWHIGLTNLTGTWRWLSNHSLTFNKWQIGEPEMVSHKRYVTMAKNWPIGSRGLFNSLRADISRARICEYTKGKYAILACYHYQYHEHACIIIIIILTIVIVYSCDYRYSSKNVLYILLKKTYLFTSIK